MQHRPKKCYYQHPSIRLEGQTRKLEVFDKINQALDKTKSKNFKKLALETWKYDGIKKEQLKLVDLKAKDTDITPRRNLGAYVISLHFIALRITDIVNYRLGSLYNSWALDSRTNIYICNDRNRSNYTITRVASTLDVIDSSKQTYLIESFKIVIINIDTTTRLACFQLRNIALAPRFMSNLVFIDILAKQYIYQSSRKLLVLK